MSTLFRLGLLALLIASMPVAPASAQVSQADYTQALDLFQAGQYREAETAFRRILPHSTDAAFTRSLLWNIARCLEERKVIREAIAAYEKFAGSAISAEEKERVRLKLEKMQSLILGGVAVSCGGPGATVALEHPPGSLGDPRPCPTQFTEIDAERVVIVAYFEGAEPVRQMVNLTAGATIDITLTPPAQPAADAGIWPWVTVGTGAALIGTGVAFYVSNQSNVDKLWNDRNNQGLRDAVDRDRNLAITGYVLGGTALIAGAAWLIHEATAPDISTAARITPMGLEVSF